jgi:hypothetical protein
MEPDLKCYKFKLFRMRRLFLTITVIVFLVFAASGQTARDVPAGLKSTFTQEFPTASKIEWSRENDREWEAEFKFDGKECSATFDNAGKWIETESEISLKEIPAVVKITLGQESAGYKIRESVLAVNKDGKVYEFLLSKNKKETELLIGLNGKMFKKEKIAEVDEKGPFY